jgi:regulator of sigma E protease
MSWPVWIVKFINDTSYLGLWFLAILAALISINLWVMNILPIPALDWWRFFIILLNSFFKKLFNKKIIAPYTEAILHSMFFILLIWMIFFITYNDIEKIIK